jgi:hypothetical protein
MTCGQYGYLSKVSGKPCGQILHGGDRVCIYHDPDPSRAKAMQSRGGSAASERKLPDRIRASVRTIEDLQAAYEMVIEETATVKKADFKRLDVILKALSGANAVLQTASLKELNETMLRAEGHGPALVILEGLKAGKMKRLPGVVERAIRSSPVQEAEVG